MFSGALPTVIHIADTFRWWSVPGGFLAAWLLLPIVWKLGRMLAAAELCKRGYCALADTVAVEGNAADTIMRVSPRFWAMFAGLVFAVSTVIAGTIIPLSRSGLFDQTLLTLLSQLGFIVGEPSLAWRVFLIPAWTGWAVACWILALAFSPRPGSLAMASIMLWWASYFATDRMGSQFG